MRLQTKKVYLKLTPPSSSLRCVGKCLFVTPQRIFLVCVASSFFAIDDERRSREDVPHPTRTFASTSYLRQCVVVTLLMCFDETWPQFVWVTAQLQIVHEASYFFVHPMSLEDLPLLPSGRPVMLSDEVEVMVVAEVQMEGQENLLFRHRDLHKS